MDRPSSREGRPGIVSQLTLVTETEVVIVSLLRGRISIPAGPFAAGWVDEQLEHPEVLPATLYDSERHEFGGQSGDALPKVRT